MGRRIKERFTMSAMCRLLFDARALVIASQRRHMSSAARSFHANVLRAPLWLCAGLLLLLTGPISVAQQIKPDAAPVIAKINPTTYRFIKSLPADSLSAFWVLFQDKGIQSDAQYRLALKESAGRLSERSLRRRALRGRTPSTDFGDIPVNPEYINRLEDTGARIRVVSNWLNAASVLADKRQIEQIAEFAFVREIKPVVTFLRKKPEFEQRLFKKPARSLEGSLLEYGQSYAQLAQIHVPDFHRIGFTGEGVLITLLDTGFFIHHPAFEHILNAGRLVATWDFINGDENVEDEDDAQRSHGTSVWSVVGGLFEDTLVGAAYGADYALAKTELVGEEIQIEEDHWVAGIEWAESIGTDIVSSSLGYTDWYTYQDMDGNTALSTIAADLAVSKGVVVVNAAGNERTSPWYYILAPADGDSVIAVGAVDLSGEVAPFSSAGPTYDGRTKPDVMALGVGDFCATKDGSYGYTQGTSFATPLVAGACALLLEANPTWNPIQVRQALWTTASQADHRDNLMGYGIVNAAKASGFSYLESSPEEFDLEASFGDTRPDTLTLSLTDWQGRNLTWTARGDQDWITVFPDSESTPSLVWVIVDPSGLKAGINRGWIEISADSAINASTKIPVTLTVYPHVQVLAFPNPFTDSLTLVVEESPTPRQVKIAVFTAAGELVCRFPEDYGEDIYQYVWDGKNENGEEVASGIYLLRIDVGSNSQIKKVAKVK
jgi:serine protease AprX